MDKFNVRLGSLVDEGALLTTMSDISKLWVYFNVSEKDYRNLAGKKNSDREPIKVRFIMANGKEFKHTGHRRYYRRGVRQRDGDNPLSRNISQPGKAAASRRNG